MKNEIFYDNEEDGIVVVVNELFEDYMPLMPKGFGGIVL